MQTTQRTIIEVLNNETGECINANEFFQKTFAELTVYRSELQKAINNYRDPLFTCFYCRQKVRIRGGISSSTKRKADAFHFAHLKDSPECPIKTKNDFTREEVDRIKYNGAVESVLHRTLKEQIAECLRRNQESKGEVSNIEVERQITNPISREWKKPDINAFLDEKRIAIELQLSTTWLDVITERQHFYRERGIYIFWIFPHFESDDDLRKLTFSDVIYTNNENAYIFDKETYELSKASNDLILRCYYKQYTREGLNLYETWENAFIKLSDLTFDKQNFRMFYHDSGTEKHYLGLEIQEQRAEMKKLERKKELKEEKQKKKQVELDLRVKSLNEFVEKLKSNEENLSEDVNKLNKNILKNKEDLTNLSKLVDETLQYFRGVTWKQPFYDNDELLNSMQKDHKTNHNEITLKRVSINEELKGLTKQKENINNLKSIEIDGVNYKHLDQKQNWDFIKSNYQQIRLIHKDSKDLLFAGDDLTKINSEHELLSLQYRKDLLFLMNFEGRLNEITTKIETNKKILNSLEESLSDIEALIGERISAHLNEKYICMEAELIKRTEEQELLCIYLAEKEKELKKLTK